MEVGCNGMLSHVIVLGKNHLSLCPRALTPIRFDGLLRRLDADRDRAGEQYEEIRWKLVKFFQWNSCVTAEDLADETFDRVAQKLDTEQEVITDVVGFIWGVAMNIGHEARKREAKTVRLSDTTGEEAVSDRGTATDALYDSIHTQRQFRCLNICMQRLPGEDQRLLLTYRAGKKHYVESRKKLATKLAISAGALRVRIIRLRAKLEQCMTNCIGRW